MAQIEETSRRFEDQMTEDEGELLHDICNQWYREFSALVNGTLVKAPPHLRFDLKEMLTERSSPWGSDEEIFFTSPLPDTNKTT